MFLAKTYALSSMGIQLVPSPIYWKEEMCTFVSFSGYCLSFQHFTVNCHSRIFKMFYLEMNLCRKCSENKNELQFCAHHLKFIWDRFLEWREGYFEASFTAETRLWYGKSVIFISFAVKNKKPLSHLWSNPGFGRRKKKHCLWTP